MRILSMTATFGKLDNDTLELSRGLNVLTAPNEWGKSTWCAFLMAMFYGIDTRERTTAVHLADKERYQPWSGRPMEGRVRLEYQGRDITIERKTRGKVPMGDFYAYETRSGLPVKELTAANCGQTLLGVERNVFQRTGFIQLKDMPVEGDEALRDRLNSLVTTGDESGKAELLSRKLRELKNRCRYNRTGLIPECQEQIRSCQEQLHQQEVLLIQAGQLEDQIARLDREMEALENHRNNLAYEEAEADRQRVEYASNNLNTARRLLQALDEKYGRNADRAELLEKYNQGRSLLDRLDDADYEKPAPVWPMALLWTIAALMLVLVLFIPRAWPVLVLLALGFAVAALVRTNTRRRSELERRMELQRIENRRSELEQAMEQWSIQLREQEELENARENVRRMEEHLQALRAMARKVARPEMPDELTFSREETMRRMGEVEQNLRRYHLQLAQISGKLESMPDGEILSARLELERDRLRELERTYRALEYAQKALDAAMQELQRRFAPRIARRAGEFLSHMTNGRYDRIAIGDDLSVHAAQETELTLRGVRWRSDGTADQMYLALRIAVWEVLCPEAPLVLDEALARFDQKRMEAALEVLKELGKDHQILLMSCQEREEAYITK